MKSRNLYNYVEIWRNPERDFKILHAIVMGVDTLTQNMFIVIKDGSAETRLAGMTGCDEASCSKGGASGLRGVPSFE